MAQLAAPAKPKSSVPDAFIIPPTPEETAAREARDKLLGAHCACRRAVSGSGHC